MSSDGNSQFPEPQQGSTDINTDELLEQNDPPSNKPQNSQSLENQEKKIDSDDELDMEDSDDLPYTGDETLIDMFSYYFIKYQEEAGNLSPSPSYFNNLSHDEEHLLRIFKQYYNSYKNRH